MNSIRSRADIFPSLCCRSRRFAPPPSSASRFRFFSSATFCSKSMRRIIAFNRFRLPLCSSVPPVGSGYVVTASECDRLASMSSFPDQMGFTFRPPERRVWKVRDLVAAVRTHIERESSDAWVEGEISNFRAPDSGHLYFTLKDGNAQIKVVMFRSSARLLRFKPADGLQVVA